MSAAQRLKQQTNYLTPAAAMTDIKRPDITLYTDSTPNGIKISIALEELGLVRINFLAMPASLTLTPTLIAVQG